jgi:hypothetical protein
MRNQLITLPLFESHTVNQIADKTLCIWARSQLLSQLLTVSDSGVDDSVLQNQSNTLPVFENHTANQIADKTLRALAQGEESGHEKILGDRDPN